MGRGTRYALTATRPRSAAVARLAVRHRRVGLEGVLRDLDRVLEPARVPGRAAGDGWAWDRHDGDDPSWWPQGVAPVGGGGVLLVSWYAKRRGLLRTPGVRISVVDRRSPGGPRYRHVLLVVPRRPFGVPTTSAVPVHAGGIAVHGDLLYVADTLFGVRLFRLPDVLDVGGAGAHGHRYVLPQHRALRLPLLAGRPRLRFSFLSTGDREGRPVLVAGEYRRAGGVPRLVAYALDEGTGLPVADGRGRMHPVEVHVGQPDRMQGAAVHGSTWFVTASTGRGVAGDLYAGAPGAWVRHRRVLPPGPEDLGWSAPGDELWCASEWPGSRWLFPVTTGPWRPAGAEPPGS